MKWTAILLTVYFLSLNVLPCNDTSVAIEGEHTTLSIDLSDNHNFDCELCSPFCQCHCCHVHTVNFGVSHFEPLQLTIPQNNFAHFDRMGKEISIRLFQPPKG
ncbi:DUF6660 family protein [Robiginitalea biformata]|uniref:DUF6660 family protein n=1 Tax=Robiginitalea biformata TaxID=252307 RepID=UPI0002E5A979|nr:DUF6660 family protein [Robiginitalea biformata]